MRGRRRERLRVESRVHDTNLRSVGEQNRCQVGPTILFECPAQIPRSFLRSFSLWARPKGPFIELENFGIFRHFLMRHARKLLMSLV